MSYEFLAYWSDGEWIVEVWMKPKKGVKQIVYACHSPSIGWCLRKCAEWCEREGM